MGLKIYPRIKFQFDGRKRDLDVLIPDEAQRFGLVCQLKWLTQPGRISGVIYNDREISKGIDQAELAFEWVRSNLVQLSQRTDLPVDDLKRHDFVPMVMCKRTLASGYLRRLFRKLNS